MIFSDSVVLTYFEHRYAPINSKIEPRTSCIQLTMDGLLTLCARLRAPLENAVARASVSLEPMAKLMRKDRAVIP